MSLSIKSENLLSEYSGKRVAQISAFLVYCCINIVLYIYSNSILESRKSELLNAYYKIILNTTIVQLDNILEKFPLDKGNQATINIEKTEIQSCYKGQCIKTRLLDFASTIDKYVSNFINYKIEINKQLLHCNNTIPSYELEKIHHINNKQISIGISIDPGYLESIKAQITKPFHIVTILLTLLLMLFIWTTKAISKWSKQFYSNQYKNIYDLKWKAAQADYEHRLLDKESLLMKRIWSLEYAQERDIELNQLFSKEVNELAIITQKIDYLNFVDQCSDKIFPCSLILYFQDNKQEKIRIKDLIETFSKRFAKSEENISFDFVSYERNINFVSKASLYQIIYSIITYISFMLKEQPDNLRYNIKLDIMNEEEGLCLLFQFDGNPIKNEDELFKYSAEFFKKHVNPFLLSIDQIFFVLREESYECSIGHNNTNFIKIAKKSITKTLGKLQDNIIKLPKRSE